jgi:hypothetical protein
VLVVAGVAAEAPAQPGPAQDYTVDVRASTYLQLFQRNLAPGVNGAVLETEQLAPVYGYAFMRVAGADLPWAKDAINAELAVWGALGLLPQPASGVADGDIVTAWVQGILGPFRVKLGRQVSMPGAARYVRYDGGDLGLRLGGFDVHAYAGFVALPRWNRPRGYYILGSTAEALKDPTLLEAQSRDGQWVMGARVGWVGTPWLKVSVAYHEQHESMTGTRVSALAYRSVAADALFTRLQRVVIGGRVVYDLVALSPAEARVYADVLLLERLPVSIDYGYQAPALLLPVSSILAAFGGGSWHELGAELTWKPNTAFRLVLRGAGQAYSDTFGYRALARGVWTPDETQRLTVLAEYARVGTSTNGYHNLRAAARYRLVSALSASLDGGAYLYDAPVRDAKLSATAFANLEYALPPHFRFLVGGSVATTPYAAFDAQLLVRAVYELDSPSSGGGM